MTGEAADSAGLTQRELLLEMRSEIKAIAGRVDQIVRDQAVAAERRSTMSDRAARIDAAIADHGRRIGDVEDYVARERGAVSLARWAVGASGIALVLVVAQIVSTVAHAVDPSIPQVP